MTTDPLNDLAFLLAEQREPDPNTVESIRRRLLAAAEAEGVDVSGAFRRLGSRRANGGRGPLSAIPQRLRGALLVTLIAAAVVTLLLVPLPRLLHLRSGNGSGTEPGTQPTWVVSRFAAPSLSGDISQVACVTADWCMAVGTRDFGTVDIRSLGPPPNNARPLAELFDGGRWTASYSPGEKAQGGNLIGVSCGSRTFCIAIGDSRTSTYSARSLIMRWDGTRWSEYTPSVLTQQDVLLGISCSSSQFCMVVGRDENSGTTLALELSRNRWALVPTPNDPTAGPTDSEKLNAVACWSPEACVAVGDYYHGVLDRVLTARFNGRQWIRIAADNPGTVHSQLLAVSCVDGGACDAVGDQNGRGSLAETLVGQDRWVAVPVPSFGVGRGGLADISCGGVQFCAALGQSGEIEFLTSAGQWRYEVRLPTKMRFQLNALTCPSSSFCIAAGSVQTISHFAEGSATVLLSITRAPAA